MQCVTSDGRTRSFRDPQSRIVLWVARRAERGVQSHRTAVGLAALSITFSTCYSRTGWLYRYEYILVAPCVCALALGLESLRQCVDLTNLTQRTRRLLTVVVLGLAVIALLDGVRDQPDWSHRHGRDKPPARQYGVASAQKPARECRSVIGDIGMVSFLR